MVNFKASFLSILILLLAACSGTALKVSPDSASTTASGDTITLSASGAGGVTWSLSPELGSLSATSGASVTYTPPRRVESTQTVTVTATSGGASASAVITVEPLVVDVNGTVLNEGNAPVGGVEVAIIGYDKVTTDSEGRFSYSEVIAPYVIAVKNSDTNFYVYGGLTKSDPVLFSNVSGVTYGADIAGTISNTTNGNRLGVELVSNGATYARSGSAADGSTDYSHNAFLLTPTASGQLYALEWTRDANGNASSFTGYASYPNQVFLATGGSFSGLDMSLESVTSSHEVSVSISLPAGAYLSTYSAGVRFATADALARSLVTAHDTSPSSSSFTVYSPGLSNAYTQVLAFATESSSSSLSDGPATVLGHAQPAASGVFVGIAWYSALSTASNVAVSFPARPELQQPADGASNVAPGTSFSWVEDPNALNFVRFSGPIQIVYFAAENVAQLPDLSAFGVSYASGDSYNWNVGYMRFGEYCNDLNDFTSEGALSFDLEFLYIFLGLQPATAEGYYMASSRRSFTIR